MKHIPYILLAICVLCAALPLAESLSANRATKRLTAPDPALFWAANADGINAIVIHPKPTKKVFAIIPPFNMNVTDIQLVAMLPGNGARVYDYTSADPTKQIITSQIWTTRPLVRFTWIQNCPANPDPRRQAVQGDTSIDEQTEGAEVWGFIIEIPYGEVPQNAQWVYALMTPFDFITQDGETVWFPIAPMDL